MTLRFRRSIKLFPGVHVNLGLHGAGLSVGPRGFHVGVNLRGMYTGTGIPGTGLYAVHHSRSTWGEPQVVENDGSLLLVLFIGILVLIAAAAGK